MKSPADKTDRYFPLVHTDSDDPKLKPIFDGMRARGAGPLHIHRTIAHAPQVFEGFAAFATALRAPGATTRAERELVILRTTYHRKAEYEYIQHRRIALGCGLSREQVDGVENWHDLTCYSQRQIVMLEFTDAMMANGEVADQLLDAVKAQFTLQEIVEISMISAFYTAVSQLSHTLRIRPETEVTDYGISDRQY